MPHTFMNKYGDSTQLCSSTLSFQATSLTLVQMNAFKNSVELIFSESIWNVLSLCMLIQIWKVSQQILMC